MACEQRRRTVDLRHVAAALDADAHVHVGEARAAEQQHRLENLEAQNLGLNQLQRDAWRAADSACSAPGATEAQKMRRLARHGAGCTGPGALRGNAALQRVSWTHR
jgi:hypothetical protein